MESRKKIVVVGGGFGGVYTCLYLQKYFRGVKNCPRIVLVSKEDYFLFTPLLHEVATGSVSPSNIVQPLGKILDFRAVSVLMACAKEVGLDCGVVVTNRGEVSYDYLVLAAGAETRVFDFSAQNVFGLKSLEDAARIKNRIIEMFNQASEISEADVRKRLLTFVVIGGGPTGVELILEMHEFIYDALLPHYPGIKKEEISLNLIHAQEESLRGFDYFIRDKASQVLKRKNKIRTLFNTRVDKIDSEGVWLENGNLIATATPILVAGVAPVAIKFSPRIHLDSSGQVPVNGFLQLSKYHNVFVIGDMAKVIDAQSGGVVPQTAQVAVAQARLVAYNVAAMLNEKPTKAFVYREKGQLVSLGRWNAAAKINGFRFSGPLAWWIWRTVYASKIIGWGSRIRVVIDWTIGILYPRDITKL